MDVEKICHDQADMTGISTLGGVQLTIFLNNMFADKMTEKVDGTTDATLNRGVVGAYIHTEQVSMLMLSAGGVMKEE